MKSKNRLYELDSLRGIAALLVVLSHYTWAYDFHFKTLDDHAFHFPYGDFGVQFFFIISGFVIFMSLDNTKTIKHFAISRFSRLYPTYWICLVITLLVISLFPVPTLGDYSFKEIVLNLSMIQGYLKFRHIDQVYWSLGVELIFYFIMGTLFYFNKLKQIHVYSILWLLITILSHLFDFPLEKYINQLLILKHAPLFISGIMFYVIRYKNATLLTHLIIIASFLIYILSIKTEYLNRNQMELTVVPYILLTLVYIVFYVLSYRNINLLKNKVLLFFGKISYPLYLLHNVIGYAIIYRVKKISDNTFVYASIAAILTISLAFLVSQYFEFNSSKWVKKKMETIF